jgi:threonyl-tRNA synthetase
MIHRVVLGAIERFIGVLIEHYSGAFPLWLSPVQAIIMTITDRHQQYAQELADLLMKEGVRLDTDLRNEKIGFKIREARGEKIPYMIIVGDKEMANRTLAVRKRGEEGTTVMSLEQFLAKFRDEVAGRS